MGKVVDIFNSVLGGYEDIFQNLHTPVASMVSDRIGIVDSILTRFRGEGENLITNPQDLTQSSWNTKTSITGVDATHFTATAQDGRISEGITTLDSHYYCVSFEAKVASSDDTNIAIRHGSSETGTYTLITDSTVYKWTGSAWSSDTSAGCTTTLTRYYIIVLGASGGGTVNFGLQDVNTSGWQQITFTNIMVEDLGTYSYLVNPEPRDFYTGTIPAEWPITDNGLQHDGAGTNLCIYSEDFSSWTAGSTSASANVNGPDGITNSAYTITGGGGGYDNRQYPIAGGTLTDNEQYTVSLFVKEGTSSAFTMVLRDTVATTNRADTDFAWSSGVISVDTVYAGTAGVQSIGNGWYRIWITTPASVVVGANTHAILIYPQGYGNASADSTVCFGAQLEETPYMTSYIPTNGTPITRTTMASSSGTEGLIYTMSTLFKNLMGDVADSPFTAIIELESLFDNPNLPYKNIVAVTNSDSSLTRFGWSELLVFDGTNSSGASITGNSAEYEWAIRVYDDSGMKIQSGVSEDSGSWAWDASPGNYDGSFSPATYFKLFYQNEWPFNMKRIRFFDYALTTAQIEAGNYDNYIEGDVAFGHTTGVTEANDEAFADWWSGDGQALGSGDGETLGLNASDIMYSDIIHTGTYTIQLLQNDYGTGDTVTLSYRHASTQEGVAGATWNTYSAQFDCLGWLQIRAEG